MKVLVVEDEPVSRAVLKAELTKLGHECVSAPDGSAAWEILARDPIRVVISDWNMPVMDGLELCANIRSKMPAYIYFILLTNSYASAQNQDAARAAGVDDFLNKPVNSRELGMRLFVAERILGYTSQILQLESLIPICSYCKNIRNDKNYWQEIETYISERTGSKFSHSICPGCYDRHILKDLEASDRAKGANPGTGGAQEFV